MKSSGISLVEVIVSVGLLLVIVMSASTAPALGLSKTNEVQMYAQNLSNQVGDQYRSFWSKRSNFLTATKPSSVPVENTKLDYDCQYSTAISSIGATVANMRTVTISVTCPSMAVYTLPIDIGVPL